MKRYKFSDVVLQPLRFCTNAEGLFKATASGRDPGPWAVYGVGARLEAEVLALKQLEWSWEWMQQVQSHTVQSGNVNLFASNTGAARPQTDGAECASRSLGPSQPNTQVILGHQAC